MGNTLIFYIAKFHAKAHSTHDCPWKYRPKRYKSHSDLIFTGIFFSISLFLFFFFFYKKSIDLSTVICHVVNIGGLRMTNCYKSTVLSNQIDETQDSAW